MIYYAYVQRPGEALFRQPILAYQKKKQVIGNTEIPETSRMLDPDPNGVISFDERADDAKDCQMAMKRAMADLNVSGKPKRIVGPFEDDKEGKKDGLSGYQKALLASVEERPKTADELVAIKDAEIAELKKQLTEKEPKEGAGKQ